MNDVRANGVVITVLDTIVMLRDNKMIETATTATATATLTTTITSTTTNTTSTTTNTTSTTNITTIVSTTTTKNHAQSDLPGTPSPEVTLPIWTMHNEKKMSSILVVDFCQDKLFSTSRHARLRHVRQRHVVSKG